MADAPRPGPEVRNRRQATVDALCEHFANDVLDMDEFERRVDLAHRAATLEELEKILADLPSSETNPVPSTPEGRSLESRPPGTVAADRVREKDFALAVLGSSSRTGRWIPARWTVAVGIMGGVKLDFREAMLGPGVTEVTVFAMWGGVEIIVPPGMDVEARGLGLMGGFEHADHAPVDGDPRRPRLRIRGLAVMGGVDVQVRYPGESGREAKKRLRRERKERRLRRGD